MATQNNYIYNQKTLLLHNWKMYKARTVETVINECGFEELEHPPYSSDLAPFYLFPKLKNTLVAFYRITTATRNCCGVIFFSVIRKTLAPRKCGSG